MEAAAGSSTVVKPKEPEGWFHKVHDAIFDDLPDLFAKVSQAAFVLPGADDDVAENWAAVQFIGLQSTKEPVSFASYRGGHLPVERSSAHFAEYMNKYEKPPSDVQQAAMGVQLYNTLTIPSHNDGNLKLFPFRAHIDIKGQVQLRPNAMYTQAERNVCESPNVINVVGAMDNEGNLSIRSGVYNTRMKAQQIMAAVRAMYEIRQKELEIPVGKVRLIIQQLNSPGIWKIGERRLIDGQCKQSHMIEQLIDPWLGYQEAPQVAYFNTNCNQTTKLPGQSSHKKNLVGAAALVEWMCQDHFAKETPDFLKTGKGHKRMRMTLQRILTARDKLSKALSNGLSEEAGVQTEILEKQNKILKKRLREVGGNLIVLSGELSGENSAEARMQAVAARVIGHIALQQTDSAEKSGLRKLNAMEEISTHFLAGRLVNAMILKNCWSGVDRTGFASALEYAIDQKLITEMTVPPHSRRYIPS